MNSTECSNIEAMRSNHHYWLKIQRKSVIWTQKKKVRCIDICGVEALSDWYLFSGFFFLTQTNENWMENNNDMHFDWCKIYHQIDTYQHQDAEFSNTNGHIINIM